MKAEKALKQLVEGNQRFASDESTHPNLSEIRREEVIEGQRPFAAVVTCSDSRTPPEILFDRGLGDLFVIRTAGNVLGEISLGSVELAVEECGVRLIMVLGHQHCGAVKMAVEREGYKGHGESIVNHIKPAVNMVKDDPGDLYDNVARANVRNVVYQLENSQPILKNYVDKGKLQIVGGYYWLDDGKVELL